MRDLLKSVGQEYLLESVSTIKGIGPKTINKIYKKIGSIENIGKLEVENISSQLGIRKDLAKKIQTSVKEIYT